MVQEKHYHRGLAAALFLISFGVYLDTIAPTTSFWDCGEFITCSFILGVPHPPGAPFFLLLGRIFSMLPIAADIGLRVNIISALTTALTVTLTYLIIGRVIQLWRGQAKTTEDRIIVYGSSVLGALAFAFSDSLWFNAVEAEVYAISMFFTAIIIWLALVWHDKADSPSSDRYILLIAYCIGLAIGIHLLNILALPAIFIIIFFRKYPTGFTVFQVAKPAANSLTIAQAVAALGTDLKGKKIIISFTPALFQVPMLDTDYYTGNFSRLHAYEFIYHPGLTWELKHRAALRMLDYPETLQSDPLLSFSIQTLARDSFADPFLYYSTFPLGRFFLAGIRLQDHVAALKDLSQRKISPFVYKKEGEIGWNHYFKKALKEQIPLSNNNPYGIDNRYWEEQYQSLFTQPILPASADEEFLTNLKNAKEWTDLQILLQVLKESGAEPLLLSRPLNRPFLEALGISPEAQKVYYQKLSQTVLPYGFLLVDFQELDHLTHFSVDRTSHPGLLGWIYVNRAIDDFYHNRLSNPSGGTHE